MALATIHQIKIAAALRRYEVCAAVAATASEFIE